LIGSERLPGRPSEDDRPARSQPRASSSRTTKFSPLDLAAGDR